MAVEVKPAIIAQAGTESAVVSIAEDEVVGIEIPTIDSANVTFLVSSKDGGPFTTLFKSDGSAAYTITAATGLITVWIPELAPVGFVKVKTSAAQTTAARTFNFLLKKK